MNNQPIDLFLRDPEQRESVRGILSPPITDDKIHAELVAKWRRMTSREKAPYEMESRELAEASRAEMLAFVNKFGGGGGIAAVGNGGGGQAAVQEEGEIVGGENKTGDSALAKQPLGELKSNITPAPTTAPQPPKPMVANVSNMYRPPVPKLPPYLKPRKPTLGFVLNAALVFPRIPHKKKVERVRQLYETGALFDPLDTDYILKVFDEMFDRMAARMMAAEENQGNSLDG